jgi:adenylylsulfate kinase-like enzyme
MGIVIWFTGQPGSGKTTLAKRFIEDKLINFMKINPRDIVHIDGDDIRKTLAKQEAEDYSRDGRFKNINWAKDTSVFLVSKGFLSVVSMVSPYRWMREDLKMIGKGIHCSKLQPLFEVLEVYCHTSEIRGKEKYFVDDYQEPLSNFLDMDTTNKTIEECLDEILTVYRQMAAVA